ncbi:MAG: 50S ribosomal protein L5 [Thermoplasmatales archaeon]|jgi:large subunit ribosomal protein L5|nr:50S ribosomal protein L5 [Thermoplasmatales archaeon]
MTDMRDVVIDKVTINIGVGESGEKLEKAKSVLKLLTTGKPVMTKAKRTSREFGVRQDQPIGVKVTLKGEEMDRFLKAALWVKNNKCLSYSFSEQGSYSFGIADYTDFKGMKYNPEIGIFGMDVVVTFKRRGGYRVARRWIAPRPVPQKIRVKREEMMKFMRENYSVEILEVG